jgi:dimethylhistidine N-methyltransferase
MPTSNPISRSPSHAPASQTATGQSALDQRLRIDNLLHSADVAQSESNAAADVIQGLTQTQKSLPPQYFYDERGSELFEQICDLPEYYLTRTETEILRNCAGAIAQLTGTCELVELGSGSSTKTRILLDAYQQKGLPLYYSPIDVSPSILESSAKDLLQHYPTLIVHGWVGTFRQALQRLNPSPLPSRMICFIGSTLGNLAPAACDAFFSQITQALQPGEYFLLGIDLQKPTDILEAAYNDRQGVTAAFNLNMLRHLNHKFDADFDLTQFEHWAFYNAEAQQIEMHLRSRIAQTVHLKALDLTVTFEAGETILSEISRKFNLPDITAELRHHDLNPVQVWTDANQWFGVVLCQAHHP